jgi:hypothetical protein
MGLPGVLVAVLIGMTLFTAAAQAVFPSGVIAIRTASALTLIGLPAVWVAVLIGMTVPQRPTA